MKTRHDKINYTPTGGRFEIFFFISLVLEQGWYYFFSTVPELSTVRAAKYSAISRSSTTAGNWNFNLYTVNNDVIVNMVKLLIFTQQKKIRNFK